MIPVKPQPEPLDFDAKVRQPGQAWLQEKGLLLSKSLPEKTNPKPCWRNCLDDLYREYDGVCAYLAIHIERAAGAVSVDHFVAKSTSEARLLYEWSNYRLACLAMNARKHAFDDVIDPFTLPEGVFQLELVTGRLYVNPSLRQYNEKLFDEAIVTINRLQLDNGSNRAARARHFRDYVQQNISALHLKKTSPFVWYEVSRQGFL